MEITKDMKIGDLLQMNEMIAPFLMQNGMGCVYCPASLEETLDEACLVHGMDADMLAADLTDVIREYEETHQADATAATEDNA